ncbi:MAG: SLC13 family permease [Myxococcota bacterium]
MSTTWELSPARIGLLLAAAAFAAIWWSPLPLEPEAHRLAAVFGAIVVLWISEALPIAVTALLIAPAMIATGVCDARAAFAPYADPLLFLFVGGFFIARSMARHGLDRRIARAVVGGRWVAGRPARIRLAFMFAGVLLSMWISNTASTAILVPILLGAADEEAGGDVLAVAYACSLGGLGTLVGSPPNLITARMLDEAGHPFGFVDWMAIGLPTALLLTLMVFFLMQRLAPPKAIMSDGGEKRRPWSRGEKVTALAFGLAVVGWMVPGLLKAGGLEIGRTLSAALPGGSVALLAASVLFVFTDTEGERVLPWNEAVKIDWGIIMLFGGGLALGKQMVETGLAEAMGRGFVAATGITELWILTIVVTVFTIFFTEVCSNTASANMIVPLVIAVAVEMDVNPVPPTLAVGLAASCAFMLPIATGPNAIAYGTGTVTQRTMMRTGLWLNLTSAAVIVVVVFLLA